MMLHYRFFWRRVMPTFDASRPHRVAVFQQIERAFAAVAFVVCLGSNAHADQNWTGGAYAGGAWTHSADVTLVSSTNGRQVLPDVTFRSESFESPIYYGYRVGHRLGRTALFVEGELIHLKVVANEQTLAPPLESLAMTHGMNLILGNALWMTRAGSDRVRVTLRGGLGITVPHAETRIHGQERGAYEYGSIGWQLAPGVAMHATGPLYLNAEYKFTSARPEIETVDGQAAVPARSHHWLLGVAAMF
jgi:opacity protein-like surface antigen